jgi:uncharacterized protein
MFFDPQYLLLVAIPSMILAFWAQMKVKNAMARYGRVATRQGVTGAQAAEHILASSGVHDVTIETTSGWLSDHYDPSKRVLRLSPQVYNGTSLAAVGIAAHEAGHALQQAARYAPLAVRSAIVPLASFSNLAWPILIIGIVFKLLPLVNLAILVFFGIVALQFVNLPVEYNASRRARHALLQFGVVDSNEDRGVKAVLNAAALTYVAAALGALLQLLYFIGIARRQE